MVLAVTLLVVCLVLCVKYQKKSKQNQHKTSLVEKDNLFEWIESTH